MSVSQVKKRFSEFESFLKKDKEGLRRLKLLKDDVNALRTSLAAAEEAEKLAIVVKDAARDRADKAESDAESMKLEIHRLRQQVANLTREIASISVLEDDPDDIDDTEIELDDYVKGMKATLKGLRHGRELPRCPKPADYKTEKQLGIRAIYLREDIAIGWSHKSLHTLGAAVAVLADYEGQVTIVSQTRARDQAGKGRDITAIKHFLKWFERNIDKRLDEDTNSHMWRDARRLSQVD